MPKIITPKGITIEHIASAHGYLKTGFYSMDCAFNPEGKELGIPYGTLWEIYGMPTTAKSTMAYSLASLLSAHLNTGWILMDVEGAFTPEYVSTIGENLGMGENSPIVLATGKYNNDLLDDIFEKMHDGVVDVGVIDSIGMIASQAEIDGKLGEANMGKRAFLIYQWVRKFFAFKNVNFGYIPSHATVFMINHMTDNLSPFGGPVRPGGKGKDFGAGVRVHLKREKTKLADGSLHITGTIKKLRYEGGGEGNQFQFVSKVGVGLHRGLSLIMDLRGLKVISLYKGMISYKKEKLGLLSSYLKEWDNTDKFTPFLEILDEYRNNRTDSLSTELEEEE